MADPGGDHADPVRPAIIDWVGELADLVLPRPCPGCGGPGSWCDGCAATLAGRPREPVLAESVLTEFAGRGVPLPTFRSLSRYRGPVRAAIVAGKEHGRRDLPPALGRLLGAGILRLRRTGLLPAPVWLVPAPTRARAARSRGGDPVLAMARAAAAVLAAAGATAGVAPCLRTGAGARDSVNLSAAERAANLAGRVRARTAALPAAGGTTVLVDDVLTTGATALAGCAALAAAGRQVHAVVTLAAVPPWRVAR